MCWNFQVSMITWLIGLFTAVYLFRRGNKHDITFGLFILTFSSVQLCEALMWLDQDCGTLNKISGIMAYFILWSHVLAIGIGLYLEFHVIIPIITGIVLLLIAIILIINTSWGCNKKSENGHLKWAFNSDFYSIVFVICVLFAIIYIKPVKKSVFICSIFIITYIVSYLYDKKSINTLWCWISALFCGLLLLS